MANSGEFNLTEALKQWKLSVSADTEINADSIEELESHMFETVDNLISTGLSKEEAFIIAEQRVGSVKTLKRAYSAEITFGFQRFSAIAQGVAYLVIFKVLSNLSILSTGSLFNWINSESQLLYLGISLALHSIALYLIYLLYKKVNQFKIVTQNEYRGNLTIALSLVSTIVLYFFLAFFLFNPSPSSFSIFPLIHIIIGYLFPVLFFIGLVVRTILERKKEKAIQSMA